MTDWTGEVAVVTGGANGLGAAAAKALKEEGMKIAIFDLEQGAGEATAHALDGLFFNVDVTDPASVKAGLDEVVGRMGIPRVLVNSAGIAPFAPTVSEDGLPHDPALFNKVIAINVIGTFNCSSQAAARMASSTAIDADGARGVIINVSSAAAFDAPAGSIAYAASKAAVLGIMLPMARDLGAKGIRVNAIAPGVFDTRLADVLPAEVIKLVVKNTPFPPRIGNPVEFGNAVVYLAKNTFMNAETIRLDAALRAVG